MTRSSSSSDPGATTSIPRELRDRAAAEGPSSGTVADGARGGEQRAGAGAEEEAEAEAEATSTDEHVESDRIMAGDTRSESSSYSATLSAADPAAAAEEVVVKLDGKLVKCNSQELTENELIHCNMALEKDKNDPQNGSDWWTLDEGADGEDDVAEEEAAAAAARTAEPTSSPARAAPTASPTDASTDAPSFHPTPRRDPFVLRGTIYYDRNANGERDSNVHDAFLQTKDAEYDYGLGGVTIQLMECDPSTNKGLGNVVREDKYQDGENSYATAVSNGYDVLMHPRLVGREEKGGMYNLIDIRVSRSYYIYLKAPDGFLLTGGVCNDQVEGWECRYTEASTNRRSLLRAQESNRMLQGTSVPSSAVDRPESAVAEPPSDLELELGIREGRSSRCVSVDREGMPSSHLDVGVMRLGDVSFDHVDVNLNLDLIDVKVQGIRDGGRSLLEYVLTQEDKEAIGIVTSEILAINLDGALKKKGAVLDSVEPLNVLHLAPESRVAEEDEEDDAQSANNDAATTSSNTAPARGTRDPATASNNAKRERGGGKLSIGLLVRGHYNRDLNVDFDDIVQDSINRESTTIRRQLTYYNQNCRDQTTKVVDMGFTLDDFWEIHTNRGVKKPTSWQQQREQQMQQQQDEAAQITTEEDAEELAFSSACNSNKVLPEYFEASLGGIQLKAKAVGEVTYSTVDNGGASPWAVVGGVVAVGALALFMGYFIFRRGYLKKKREERRQEAKVTHVFMDESDSSKEEDGPEQDLVMEKVMQQDSGRRGAGGRSETGSGGGEASVSRRDSADSVGANGRSGGRRAGGGARASRSNNGGGYRKHHSMDGPVGSRTPRRSEGRRASSEM